MENVAKGLIGIAALAFVLAVIAVLLTGGAIVNIPAESFSRACNNLALVAIALILIGKSSAT